jgi:hypothetical protein
MEKFADKEVIPGRVIAFGFGLNKFKPPKPILALTVATDKGVLSAEMLLDTEPFNGSSGIQRSARTLRAIGVKVSGTDESPKFLPDMPGLVGSQVLCTMKRSVTPSGDVYFNVGYVNPAVRIAEKLPEALMASLFETTSATDDTIPF